MWYNKTKGDDEVENKKELTWDERLDLEEKQYLEDIDTSIKLLETLKEGYITPGSLRKINTSKVTRIRLIIKDLLKKY